MSNLSYRGFHSQFRHCCSTSMIRWLDYRWLYSSCWGFSNMTHYFRLSCLFWQRGCDLILFVVIIIMLVVLVFFLFLLLFQFLLLFFICPSLLVIVSFLLFLIRFHKIQCNSHLLMMNY
jgi:hypothetical protein